MDMQTKEEFKQCSRCHSIILLKYVGANRKGEPFKTCENCRNHDKKYKDTHTEQIQEYRNSRTEYNKDYRELNKDSSNERQKQYYEDNKEKIAEHTATKISCECGLTHRLGVKQNIYNHRNIQIELNFQMALNLKRQMD